MCECVCEDMHDVCSFGVQAKDTQFQNCRVRLFDDGPQPIITLYPKVQFDEGPCPLIQLLYHRARVMPEQPRAGSIQWWCPTPLLDATWSRPLSGAP